jgi:hypothetical protein
VVSELVRADDNPITAFIDLRSGASRARTGDLVSATHALSQLSYGPKGVFVRPVYRRPLCIFGWPDPQIDSRTVSHLYRRNQVHAIKCLAIGRDRVDFICCVLASHRPTACQPVADKVDADHGSFQACPFALDPENLIAQLKSEVVAPVLGNRL